MTPPQLKRLGNQFVRVDNEQPVRLWGSNLYWFTHRGGNSNWPIQSASDDELAAVEHMLKTPASGGWGARVLTYWAVTAELGGIDVNGTVTHDAPQISKDHIDGLVNLCDTYDAYLHIHWFTPLPGSGPGELPIMDADARAAMRWLANRYNGNPCVFFSAWGEAPNSESNGPANFLELRNNCELTITEIRKEYPSVMCGIPGENWSQRLGGWIDTPPTLSNVFAKAHLYCGRVPNEEQCGSQSGIPLVENEHFAEALAVYDAGWPVLVAECGVGNRSNSQDLDELWAKCEELGWGWTGFAMQNLISGAGGGGPHMTQGPVPPETDLTPWGVQARDEMERWFDLGPLGDPAIENPPAVTHPSQSQIIVDGGDLIWTDSSWLTHVTQEDDWITVEHHAEGSGEGGVQFTEPDGDTLSAEQFADAYVLIHATAAQLANLKFIWYEQPSGSGASFPVGPDLRSFATDLGDGWKALVVPRPTNLTTTVGRVELENRSGAAMEPYRIASWALRPAVVPYRTVVVTHPQTSEAGEIIAGPPTVRVEDPDRNPVPNVEVNVSLNKNSFRADSVTSKTTDEDGLAAFDFLIIDTLATGYSLTFKASGS